ncbi:hypothetical protein JK359_36805 [Streptomyces actinomycinicus]|uniref:Secreted protein n=1 Tax=Streptomyces actinomycinicus TaxID=1695166 RepID=A0A937ES46_9ACTN|nr:hypothetical protein [Streptomyces actinomycinicus]MBL1087450.1 hypothetical protein [Streptomyces actinomycinicus]
MKRQLARIIATGIMAIATTAIPLAAHADAGTPSVTCPPSGDMFNIGSYGYGYWNQDPGSCSPGDSVLICDNKADGWGIEVYEYLSDGSPLDPFGPGATTRGHGAPYCSPWSTHNLAEGTQVYLDFYAVKGDSKKYIGRTWASA